MPNSPLQDCIFVRELRTRAIIGIYDHERSQRQDLLVNLVLYTDLRTAGQTDNIDDALNYKSVVEHTKDFIESSEFLLIEKLAAELCKSLFSHFEVNAIKLSLDKPAALSHVDTVGLSIYRERSSQG